MRPGRPVGGSWMSWQLGAHPHGAKAPTAREIGPQGTPHDEAEKHDRRAWRDKMGFLPMARSDQLPPNAPVPVGSVLSGKYRVDRVIGAGGMGVVLEATHLQLGERVALKFMAQDAVRDPEARARFAREARSMFKLKSQHVARVLDVAELDDGAPFMVMEYLSGRDVGRILDERRRLPSDTAVDFVLQTCEAIAEAHAIGIVHRDLKPENLFVTKRVDGSPFVKVLDFGISKAQQDALDPMTLTSSTAVMGSPFYMAPEQLKSTRLADERTDIWALGVILYECVVGEVPFVAESAPALYVRMLEERPIAPHLRVPHVPRGLSDAIMRALERDPGARFQSVAALASAIEPFASPATRGTAERLLQVGRGSMASDEVEAVQDAKTLRRVSTDVSWGTSRVSDRPRRGLAAIVAGASALAVLGVAGALVLTGVVPSPFGEKAAATSGSEPELAEQPRTATSVAPSLPREAPAAPLAIAASERALAAADASAPRAHAGRAEQTAHIENAPRKPTHRPRLGTHATSNHVPTKPTGEPTSSAPTNPSPIDYSKRTW